MRKNLRNYRWLARAAKAYAYLGRPGAPSPCGGAGPC